MRRVVHGPELEIRLLARFLEMLARQGWYRIDASTGLHCALILLLTLGSTFLIGTIYPALDCTLLKCGPLRFLTKGDGIFGVR